MYFYKEETLTSLSRREIQRVFGLMPFINNLMPYKPNKNKLLTLDLIIFASHERREEVDDCAGLTHRFCSLSLLTGQQNKLVGTLFI